MNDTCAGYGEYEEAESGGRAAKNRDSDNWKCLGTFEATNGLVLGLNPPAEGFTLKEARNEADFEADSQAFDIGAGGFQKWESGSPVFEAPRNSPHQRVGIAHSVVGSAMPAATGADRFAFAMGDRIIVLNTVEGRVFAHRVTGFTPGTNREVGDAAELVVEGTAPATTGADRFAFAMGDRIIVLNTVEGRVFAHRVTERTVGDAVVLFRAEGTLAGSQRDRFAFAIGDHIIRLNPRGRQVVAHRVTATSVDGAEELLKEGVTPGGDQTHRFAFAMRDRIIVISSINGLSFHYIDV